MKKSTRFAASRVVSITAADLAAVVGGTVLRIAGTGNQSNTGGRTAPLPLVPSIGVGNL